MDRLIWLDDKRNPFIGDWLEKFSPVDLSKLNEVIWIKSYDEFVSNILVNGLPAAICFDHDLGDYKGEEEKTGYDCAKFVVDYCISNDCITPYHSVQSDNPPGKENIDKLMQNYVKFFLRK